MNIPSHSELQKIMRLVRSIVFPAYYPNRDFSDQILRGLLYSQLSTVMCKACEGGNQECVGRTADAFVSALPELQRLLLTDVQAALYNDPAVTDEAEVLPVCDRDVASQDCPLPVAVRRASAATDVERDGTQRDGYRYSSCGDDRRILLHRPRHGRCDRRNGGYRQARNTVSGCDLGCTKLYIRCRRSSDELASASDIGG